MCRYRLCFLVTAAGNTNSCQGWIPSALPRNIFQSPSFGRVRNSRWSFSSTSRSVGLAIIPQRVTPVAVMAASGKSQDPDQQPQERAKRPTAKIMDTPIPDYLIDMLKEAGEIDENGKPVHDDYDPDDDDQFGSKRTRENNTEEKEDYFDVPYGEMLYGQKKESTEDAGTLMDTTINNAVIEYGFPLEFFLDMLCRWGVTPPINPNVRLGDIIDAEQAAGLCEALTGLDPADVRDNYLDDNLEDLAYELDIPLPDILQACAAQKINLPQGGDTHITIDEYKLLIDNVIEGGELSPTRRLFDESRMSHRWVGQKDAEVSVAFQEETARLIERNNRGFGWTNGPPILGQGKGELPIDAAHISGRIFGEDAFMSSGEEEEEDDMADIFGFEPE